jgi:hypothetical protein
MENEQLLVGLLVIVLLWLYYDSKKSDMYRRPRRGCYSEGLSPSNFSNTLHGEMRWTDGFRVSDHLPGLHLADKGLNDLENYVVRTHPESNKDLQGDQVLSRWAAMDDGVPDSSVKVGYSAHDTTSGMEGMHMHRGVIKDAVLTPVKPTHAPSHKPYSSVQLSLR